VSDFDLNQAVADVPHSTPLADYATVVYQYGCPHWADFDDIAMEQLRLAHNLRNRLVEIELAHEAALAAALAEDPSVSAAQAALADADQAVKDLEERLLRERVTDRSRVARVETKGAIKAARAARSAAKVALKAAKAAARATQRERRGELRDAHMAALTQARAAAVADGLFWSTATDVLDHHRVAAKAVIRKRVAGQPARLRFHRWDGSGTLTTQVQWQTGGPLPSPAALAAGWGGLATLSPCGDPAVRPRGAERFGELAMRVRSADHGGDHRLVVPVILHRWMPANAEIKRIQVSRRAVAGQHRLFVSVTCRVPAPVPSRSRTAVAVDVQWRGVGDGNVLVARVGVSGGPVPAPPDAVRELCVSRPGGVDMHASAEWRAVLARGERIQSVRDEMLDDLRPRLVEALADAAVADAVGVTGAVVARWRSPGRFARLARVWPQDHALAVPLELWRARDRHLWEFQSHERAQILGRRREVYRCFAAWLAGHASVIVVSDVDIAEARRRPDVCQDDPHGARGARRLVQFAAPGELRAAIVAAAARRGVEVLFASQSATTEVAA
jgi:hypothetical protein